MEINLKRRKAQIWIDPDLDKHTIQVRDRNGKLLGTIENVGIIDVGEL